ncbi:MAG: hypothetical protein RLZZ308_660, partial [Candidatus Parcubacteria bacterium]
MKYSCLSTARNEMRFALFVAIFFVSLFTFSSTYLLHALEETVHSQEELSTSSENTESPPSTPTILEQLSASPEEQVYFSTTFEQSTTSPPTAIEPSASSTEETSTVLPSSQDEEGSSDATTSETAESSSVIDSSTISQTGSSLISPLTPEITTDKPDYHPGETASIFGKFFQAFKNLRLVFLGSSELHGVYSVSEETVSTDETGSFTLQHVLDSMYVPVYNLFAYNESNEVVAQTTFTDAAGTSFDQCSTGNPSTGACTWIGSILNGANSYYFEGQTVSQRLLFTDTKIPDGVHTISFTYDYTKGGIHAYDFITTVNPKIGIIQGGPALTMNPCANLSNADEIECNILNPTSNTPILVTIPNDTFDSKDSTPLLGTGTSQSTKEQNFEIANGGLGSRKITVYTSNPNAFTSPTITLTHSSIGADSDTGDSNVLLTITFNSTGCNTGSGCDYLLYFGGHLAKSGSDQTTNSNWGSALGSSNISGGPYHIKSVKFDGGGGSLDNQIQGANILLPLPLLTLLKTVVNDGGGTATTDDFQAKIDATNVAWGIPTPLTAGIHTASEVGTTTYSSSPWGGDCASDGSITLANGEDKVCTITNTYIPEKARLTLIKEVINNNGGTALATEWTLSASGATPFSGITGTASVTNKEVDSGVYSLSESGGPLGYTASNYSCIKNQSPTPVLGNSIILNTGDVATCTITNDDQQAYIIVDKTVINDNGGTKTANDFALTVNGSP